ncbi:MAG: glycoside hydrolase family 127 protein [Lentisphaeria bacterium]|nr:glycoside hydrolase family 127 protein [Lentisphaeria bacterium]
MNETLRQSGAGAGKNPPVSAVRITGGLWGERLRVNREITLAVEYEQCRKTGRLDAWKLTWRPGDPNPPHFYWDSDVAKWLEAAGYSLALHPDPKLEQRCDDVISSMAAAQQPDGYLNTYYLAVEPGKRWSNLRDCHELYCAGHLMEAAVAYYQGTGKRLFLDVMCRYADCIARTFGRGEQQLRGYPGHEEIELALVKLAQATGESRFLDLAAFFIDERGQKPYYYDLEKAREKRPDSWMDHPGPNNLPPYNHMQAHAPVREQRDADGHAVRACYLYAGMAGLAKATGDQSLADACHALWDSVTTRRMYITGGIGSSRFGERFSFDYDLPNEEAYAETCAAIALVFFANQMLALEADAKYADVMERALFNGILSGVSHDGTHFFYDNILASHPLYHTFSRQKPPRRQEWYTCSCCPPNIARLLASLGSYLYTVDGQTAWTHLYADSQADLALGNGRKISLKQATEYPWNGEVTLTVGLDAPADFTLALRIPGWCGQAALAVNGQAADLKSIMTNGYAGLNRTWQNGDQVTLALDMPVERVYAHPAVRQDAGKVALQRGPVVYCLEQADNGPDLADLRLPPAAPLTVAPGPADLGHAPVITGPALRRELTPWTGKLYATDRPAYTACQMTAIPYFLWANRAPGEMTVWITE